MPSPAPLCTVTVFATGTANLSVIFDDNNPQPTPKDNPFTADVNALWYFWAASGTYDVQFTGQGIPVPYVITFTIP